MLLPRQQELVLEDPIPVRLGPWHQGAAPKEPSHGSGIARGSDSECLESLHYNPDAVGLLRRHVRSALGSTSTYPERKAVLRSDDGKTPSAAGPGG